MPTVAVIGLGQSGLVTVKNLLEAGFEVTGFEKSNHVGGIWHYSSNRSSGTSALESTLVNISKERCCFTDFPFDYNISSYPSARQVDEYLNKYADHFNLRPHLKLNITVRSVRRLTEEAKWCLIIIDEHGTEKDCRFDKVVLAVGPEQTPQRPDVPGEDLFKGTMIHAAEYKSPSGFRGKRVLVVGMGNSALDTATSLVDVAEQVYLSHRSGGLLLPRITKEGKALDHTASWRTFAIREFLESVAPRAAAKFFDNFLIKMQNDKYTFDPAWRISSAPSLQHKLPLMSDHIVDCLRSGQVMSVATIKRYLDAYNVELDDGDVIETDAVIYCTGYTTNMGILDNYVTTTWNSRNIDTSQINVTAKGEKLPKLYQNVLSFEFPDSLAVIGLARTLHPSMLAADLSSMAVAQLWKDPGPIPSWDTMDAWYAGHIAWAEDLQQKGGYIQRLIKLESFMQFVEDAARTRVVEHLGYGPSGWKFWWQDRRLCDVMMDGIYSPHFFRVFPGDGRKAWSNARAEILKVNELVRERTKTGSLLLSAYT